MILAAAGRATSVTRTCFAREDAPATMRTCAVRAPNVRAISSTTARFARPSCGGAATLTLSDWP